MCTPAWTFPMHHRSEQTSNGFEALARAEAARQSMARLMAVAGHDLKQPLQIALMSIERAVDEGVDQHTAQRLRLASAALGRLGYELDDLARSSQSAEMLRPRVRPVRLDQLCRQLESDWRLFSETGGVTLRFDMRPIVVGSDPMMLATIVRNLVGNAIKYCRRGGSVRVGCRVRKDKVRLEVHDTGPGIAPARLARIFDAFERGDAADMAAGLGLGLYIVKQTADLLEHPISVRSTEGYGSVFAITLPLVERG